MLKIIRSIQFLSDKVIVEFEKGDAFQFCKACKDGKHLKSFLNYFCPQVNLSLLDQADAILSEKKFFYKLSRGPTRRVVKREAHEFAEFLQGRCERALHKKLKSPRLS